jgi:hypothetical protein
MTNAVNIRSTWSSIFARKGGSGSRTKLWDDCDESERSSILGSTSLERGELPVVTFCPRGKNPALLTTRRLIHGGREVSISRVTGVEPVNFAEVEKDQLTVLQIRVLGEEPLRIEFEPGPPYFGIWSVLLHIASLNVRKSAAH